MDDVIEDLLDKVRSGFSQKTLAERETVSKSLDLDFGDHFAYQTIQSQAFAAGRITLEMAHFLYTTLGGSADQFNRQSLEHKAVVTLLIGKVCKD